MRRYEISWILHYLLLPDLFLFVGYTKREKDSDWNGEYIDCSDICADLSEVEGPDSQNMNEEIQRIDKIIER